MPKLTKKGKKIYSDILNYKICKQYFIIPKYLLTSYTNESCSGFYALHFARTYGNYDGVELEKLEEIVINSNTPIIMFKWMKYIGFSNITKFQDKMIECGDINQLNKIINLDGVDKNTILNRIAVMEVMCL